MGFVRTLLMWLLVLAVPAQGAAAATMAFCGPSHHALQSQQGASDEHEHEHHGDGAQTDHHHAQPDEDASASASVTPHDKIGHNVKHKCSACASCCAGAVLPSAIAALKAPLLADFFLSLAPRSVASVLIGGLERPPRSVLG